MSSLAVKWSLGRLIEKLNTPENTIIWCTEVGLLPQTRYCGIHYKFMNIENRHKIGHFYCKGKGVKNKHKYSRAENTWFGLSRTSPKICLLITYCFAFDKDYRSTMHEVSIYDTTVSHHTIARRFANCREVCMESLHQQYEDEGPLGGPHKIVEIDERKVGRRNYDHGQVREGLWLLAMIERDTGKFRLEICPNNRDKLILINLVKKHVQMGTSIHAECWKGYINLEENGYKHLTLNKNENFEDPLEIGTQIIENSWGHLKQKLTRGGIKNEDIGLHLCEFLWRLKIKEEGRDPFVTLIANIAKIYPGENSQKINTNINLN